MMLQRRNNEKGMLMLQRRNNEKGMLRPLNKIGLIAAIANTWNVALARRSARGIVPERRMWL